MLGVDKAMDEKKNQKRAKRVKYDFFPMAAADLMVSLSLSMFAQRYTTVISIFHCSLQLKKIESKRISHDLRDDNLKKKNNGRVE